MHKIDRDRQTNDVLQAYLNILTASQRHNVLETTIMKEHSIYHKSLKNPKVDGRHLVVPIGQRLVEEFTYKKRRLAITSNEY